MEIFNLQFTNELDTAETRTAGNRANCKDTTQKRLFQIFPHFIANDQNRKSGRPLLIIESDFVRKYKRRAFSIKLTLKASSFLFLREPFYVKEVYRQDMHLMESVFHSFFAIKILSVKD